MGCNMSLKVHFLDSHLRLLPRKSRSSERWARTAISTGDFHHGKAVPRQVEYSRLTDYCWALRR
jgi:hypothetical protein